MGLFFRVIFFFFCLISLLKAEESAGKSIYIGLMPYVSYHQFEFFYPENSDDYVRHIKLENNISISPALAVEISLNQLEKNDDSFLFAINYNSNKINGITEKDKAGMITGKDGTILHDTTIVKTYQFIAKTSAITMDIFYSRSLLIKPLNFLFGMELSIYHNTDFNYKLSIKDSLFPKLDLIESRYLKILNYEDNGETAVLIDDKYKTLLHVSFICGLKYNISYYRFKFSPFVTVSFGINLITNKYEFNQICLNSGILVCYML